MTKRSKQNGHTQIDSETTKLVKRTRGVAAEIARAADIDPAHVCRVLNYEKPLCPKMRKVLPDVLWNWARRYDSAAFRAAAAKARAQNDFLKG